MTDDQLERLLRSVGKAAFVTHLGLFQSNRSIEGAAADLMAAEGWKPRASRTRVSNARSIIEAGRLADALHIIAAARVPQDVQRAARLKRAAL